MEGHSVLDLHMTRLQQEVERRKVLDAAPAWTGPDDTSGARAARLERTYADFWEFVDIYFPPEVHTQGYAPPAEFHRNLVRHALSPGVQIELAARLHGKTVTMKILLCWLLLTGRVHIAGTFSHNMDTSSNILQDIQMLLAENPRIVADYVPEFVEARATQFQFRTAQDRSYRYCAAFSERRSVRGYIRTFSRPEFLLGDDIETRQSPMGDDQVHHRIKVLAEAYKSLCEGGTFVILGNNFDRRCALNQLKQQSEMGTLADRWRVHISPGWSDDAGPLWAERYPAKTKEEFRRLIDVLDNEEFDGDIQQDPHPPQTDTFPEAYYTEYESLPPDARGIIYTDPNLALKSRGDTTAITAVLYSPTTDAFYIPWPRCLSYADSHVLLNDVYALYDDDRFGAQIFGIAWDGHVHQESTWTNLVRSWCRISKRPFPPIDYQHYNVDDLAKGASLLWRQRRIRFPQGFSRTEEGARYIAQVTAFTGKKAGRKDDAPDSLISGLEYLHQRRAIRPSIPGEHRITNIPDPISF